MNCPKTVIGLAAATALGIVLLSPGAEAETLRAQVPAGPRQDAALRMEVKPTVFFVERDGVLKQVLEVSVDNSGPAAPGTLSGRWPGGEVRLDVAAVKPGVQAFELLIPEVKEPASAVFLLEVAGRSCTREITLTPQRKWTVYLLPHSHTDIGYTALQTRVRKNHVQYLEDVIRFCRETDDYPEGARFKWNIEAGWSLDHFLRSSPASSAEELVRLIKEGRVELSAWYLQLTDLFGHEALIRALYFGRSTARRFGFDIPSAMNNDVTGFSWAVPQLFRRAGVKYFATGINETRARAPLARPNPFYWESPDGSRILHWNGEHYMFANNHLVIPEGPDAARGPVAAYLARLQERGDYPWDLVAFNIQGAPTDNAPPSKDICDSVRDWNLRWAWPRLRLAVMREFFEDLEKRAGAGLPVHRLAWPDYWTDGVASTAYETGLLRRTQNRLLAAETFAALAAELDGGFTYPRQEIDDAYESVILFNEHTWGAGNSISQPESESARGQWALKSSLAYAASEGASRVLEMSLDRLAALIPTDRRLTVAVFNPLSWKRSDIVRMVMPVRLQDIPEPWNIKDARTGIRSPYQIDRENNVLYFRAEDVPPLGYTVFTIAHGEKPLETAPPFLAVSGHTLENEFYRLTLDPQTGVIAGLYDKELKAELVDPSAPYRLNQFIHELPRGGRAAVDNMEKRADFDRASPESASILPGLQGPLVKSLIVRTAGRTAPLLEQEIILCAGLKRVDIVNRLDKEETLGPEAVYFAFPFQVPGGSFRLEIADAVLEPETGQLPGTVRDWYAVQNWVEVAGKTMSLVWSSVEAPLVQLGDINTGKWLTRLEPVRTWLFSYALNNYWWTNFKASQGGKISFHYALTSRAGGGNTARSVRFGWEAHSPLIVQGLPSNNRGKFPKDALSFFSLDQPNVLLQAVKRAEDGEGLVLRLRELEGRDTTVRLSSPLFNTAQLEVEHLGVAEDPGKKTALSGKALELNFDPYEIKTLRVRPVLSSPGPNSAPIKQLADGRPRAAY